MAFLDDLTDLKNTLFGADTTWQQVLSGGSGIAALLASLTGKSQDQIAKTIQEQAQSATSQSATSGTSDVTSTGQTSQTQKGATTQATSGSTTGTTAQQQTGATSGTSEQATTGTTQQQGTTTSTTGGPAWWEARQQELSNAARLLPGYQAYFDGNRPVVGQFSNLEAEAVGKGREAGKSILDMGIERYMNPYLENVLNPQMRRLGEDQALQRQTEAAQRVSRGAFGTQRADQREQQMRERQTLESQEQLNKGYFNAFNNATNLAAGDAERMRQAGTFLAGMGATQRGIEDTGIQRMYDEWQKTQMDPRARLQAEAGIVGGLKPAQTQTGTTNTLGTTAQNTLGTTTGTSAQNTTGTTTGTTQQATTGTTDMSTLGSTLNQSIGTTTGQQSGSTTGTTSGTLSGVQSGTDLTDAQKLAAGLAGLNKALYPTT